MMLPRMDSIEDAILVTRRQTFLDETFTKFGSGNKDFAAVWHGTICGRPDIDIGSTFYPFLCKLRLQEIYIMARQLWRPK